MSIRVTEAAARQIRKTLERRGIGIGLRLAVKASGCAGLSYAMAIAEEVGESDTVTTSQGVNLVIDAKSMAWLQDLELDFVRDGLSESFRFNNPNAKHTCGCGESFAA